MPTRIKNRCLVLAVCLAFAGLGTAHAVADVPNHAVVLIYHHISQTTPAATSLSPVLFAAHLDYLDENGHQVRPLSAIVDSLRHGGALPDLTVGLSFDDGYTSVYTEAFPQLRKRGWPFTIFVCPDAIDHHLGPVLNWDQLREMAAAGATIANHGLHHDHLQRHREGESDASRTERVRAELLAAQERIAAEIGTAPALLAYPYGEYDPLLLELVADLGWAAFGQQSGAVGATGNFALLPRFPMAGSFAALENFGDKVRCVPLPVVAVAPASPLLVLTPGTEMKPPVLRVTLNPTAGTELRLQAFASGQGSAELVWVDRSAGVFEVQARQPLPTGRSRYNITAPFGATGRYFWFSQTWINGEQHGY